MRHIKLTLAYDGTDYHGWQVQARDRGPTVQGMLEEAWHRLTGERVRVTGAGRTDAGVHALGQVAHLATNSRIPADRVPHALNSVLPPDIVVGEAVEVDAGFHARFGATGKTYTYRIWNHPFPDPFTRRYAWHIPYPLDLTAMQQAAGALVGTHDFRALCATGSPVRNYVRTVFACAVAQQEQLLSITISGNGFLYNMVRIIVGTLVEVGRGKLNEGALAAAIRSGRREDAGPTAPPHGLFLVRVDYSNQPGNHPPS